MSARLSHPFAVLTLGLCALSLGAFAGVGCIGAPVLITTERDADGGSGEATGAGRSPHEPDADAAGFQEPPDADVPAGEHEAAAPPGDPGPGPAPPAEAGPPSPPCVASGDRICCGTVTCSGCANAESGECRECAEACAPGQLCCKRGGPPRCKPLNAQCGD